MSHALAASTDGGALGVFHLKRFWSRVLDARSGAPGDAHDEWQLDNIVVQGLGVGLEQTMQYLHQTAPAFDEFERWIVATTGGVDPIQVARINAAVTGSEPPHETKRRLAEIDALAPVLSESDLPFWDERGYVVVHDAVPVETRVAAEHAIWDHLGARPDDPDSWYAPNDHGIMVQYFQHPAFDANRRSPRIHKAFAQLWGTSDLWVTTDRVGFNAPEREGHRFRGPDLHWDVSLELPIPFGVQGIVYLTDTAPEQGALTVVPGFHRRVAAWLASLPPGADARQQDLHALGSMPIGGRAGDLVIWHQALPHGSRPNRQSRPRIVQYITMFPAWAERRDVWI